MAQEDTRRRPTEEIGMPEGTPKDFKSGLKNTLPLQLHIPAPKHRPGEAADFSDLAFPAPGVTPRPPIDAPAAETHPLANGLIRVLDDEGHAVGPWAQEIDADTLLRGLRAMMLTRAYDERMFRAQRQGKTSFYMK